MDLDHAAVTGLVLAGGRGQRMGGEDKGLLSWQGRPLAAHALARLAPQVTGLMISANRNLDTYRRWGHPVLADALGDYPGPLAGLQAGLAACDTPLLACIPCDTPNFPTDLVTRLRATLAHNPQALVTWATTDQGEHPVFLLCQKTLLPALVDYLTAGKRRVRDFLLGVGGVPTHFDQESAFANLNCPQDLALDPSTEQ
ncbi:molybdenum cofactor guanylyltransferase MobA [Denitratisoma sp. agr-D3]